LPKHRPGGMTRQNSSGYPCGLGYRGRENDAKVRIHKYLKGKKKNEKVEVASSSEKKKKKHPFEKKGWRHKEATGSIS